MREQDNGHGVFDSDSNYGYPGKRKQFFWKRLIRAGIILILFLGILGLSRLDYPYVETVRAQAAYYLTDARSDQLSGIVAAFQSGIWSDTIEKGVVEALGKLDLSQETSVETLAIPVSGKIVRAYGWEEQADGQKLLHPGVDIRGVQASAIVVAALEGNVRYIGKNARLGNYVELDHGKGIVTVYGNCQEILVMEGQLVEKGQELARLSADPQGYVHFELRKNGKPMDPLNHFSVGEEDGV